MDSAEGVNDQDEMFYVLVWVNGYEVYRTKEAADLRKAALWDRGPRQIRYTAEVWTWPRWYIEEKRGVIPA